jgi:hypothetical protein
MEGLTANSVFQSPIRILYLPQAQAAARTPLQCIMLLYARQPTKLLDQAAAQDLVAILASVKDRRLSGRDRAQRLSERN